MSASCWNHAGNDSEKQRTLPEKNVFYGTLPIQHVDLVFCNVSLVLDAVIQCPI